MQNQLVLLHGWGMNREIWQLILPELNFMYDDVVALDLPGYGYAQQQCAHPDAGTLAFMAKELAEQLADNSILVGWSLGGVVSLYLAKHYPEKVAKVVLVASSPYFSQCNEWPGIHPKVLNEFSAQLVKDSAKTIERFLAIQAMGSESARQDIKQLKALLSQAPHASEHVLTQGLAILANDDLRADFAAITQPISGIFGRLDALVPYKGIEQMQALRGDFDIAVIDKASHAPFISHKDEFLAALKSVL